jgi:hypothetical protein
LPALLLATPLVFAYFQVVARAEIWATIPLIALPVLFASLALTVAVALIAAGARRVSWRPAAAAALAGVVLLGVGVVVDRFDGANPRPDLLVYRLDADAGRAEWVALPSKPDAYTGQVGSRWRATTFVPSPFHEPTMAVPAKAAVAPAQPLAAPAASVVSDTVAARRRVLGLNVTAAPGTYAVTAEIRSTGGVRAVAVHGNEAADAVSGGPSTVRVVEFSPTTTGTPVSVTVDEGRRVEVRLTAYTVGLPPKLADRLAPRSDDLILGVHEIPDATVVTRVTTF